MSTADGDSDLSCAKSIMLRAAAVPLKEIDQDPPSERVDRLEAIIANLEYYFEQMRENIRSTPTEDLPDFQQEKSDTGTRKGWNGVDLEKRIQELSRSVRKSPKLDEGDIYAVKLEDLEKDSATSNKRLDPRVERLLKEHNEHAQRVLEKYRGYLRREHERWGIPIKGIAQKQNTQKPAQASSQPAPPPPHPDGSEIRESRDPRLRRRALHELHKSQGSQS